MDTEAKWILGAGLAIGAVLGVIIYEEHKTKAATPPAASTALPGVLPPVASFPGVPATFTPTLSFITGQTYELASTIPGFGDPNVGPQTASATDMQHLLERSGWSNVNVLFYGPADAGVISTFPQELGGAVLPFGVAGAWAARAVWTGPNGTPVPTGTFAMRVS
jgi:hypothetical protein